MCARYTIKTPAMDLLIGLFGLDPGSLPEELPPRYNVAPTQTMPVVRESADGHRALDMMRWGLVPFWSKDPKKGPPLINARADTVVEKPAFRAAFKARRCLVPADGFFEWQTTAHGKQPIYYEMKDGRPFAFAGLWEHWSGPQGDLTSYTIITTDANELVTPTHDRMPVILPAEAYATWLDPGLHDPAALVPMLAPYPSDLMKATKVNPHVNSVKNDDPACIQPLS